MYLEFYRFREKPFSLVPNPAYLYFSSKHANALTFLEYGLTEKIGFVMLTGEIGIGKTTLVRYLLNQIESDMDVAVIFNTNILSDELISLILNEFEIRYEDGISKAKALDLLYAFLIDKYSKGRKVLLIIDEAQNLSREVLEEIRMLSNLQTDDEMLLQIMIVGQPELRVKVNEPGLAQFAQRIAVSYHLSAMTLEETGKYVSYRLKKAGRKDEIFSPEAVEKIYGLSQGIPRTINLLCDACLVYGFADEKDRIDIDIVDQVIEEQGGIGVFVKRETGQSPEEKNGRSSGSGDGIDSAGLSEKIESLEKKFVLLKDLYRGYAEKMESRAEFLRDKRVSEYKTALETEKESKEKLLVDYGILKERYRLLLKKMNRKSDSKGS